MCDVGLIYNHQNRGAEALVWFQKGLAIAEATGDRRIKMRALYGTGLANSIQLRFDQAQGFYEQSIAISQELGERRSTGTALSDLGNAHIALGRAEVGFEFLKKSQVICEELNDKGCLQGVLNNIATQYIGQGRYADALEYLQRALTILEEVGTKANEEGLAIKLMNIGLVHRRQGRPDQALVYYQKSLKLMEALDHKLGIANLQNNIGVAYKSQGLNQESLEWFQKSLQRYKDLKNRAGIARSQNNIGDAYRLMGRYDQALENLQASLRLREEIKDTTGISFTLTNLGRLYHAQGKHAEMLEVSIRAAAIAEDTNDPERLWNAQELIGTGRLETGKPEEARRHFLAAIATIESLRHEVAGGQQQQSFLENRLGPWLGMVRLLVSQKEYAEALRFAEWSKARVLLDALQGGRPNLRESLSVDERKAEGNQRFKLVQLNSKLTTELRRDKQDAALVTELKSNLAKARLEYEDLEARLYAAHPELRVSRGDASIINAVELASLLPDTATVFLEYVVADDRTYLFSISKAPGRSEPDIHVHTIPIRRAELAKQTDMFRGQLADRNLGFGDSARRLYDLLLKPAQDLIRGKSSLVISPDDKLWELPFQALVAEDGRFVIEKSSVSYAPSFTVLREMKAHRRKNEDGSRRKASDYSLLAFGNPLIGKQAIERARLSAGEERFSPLPESEKEAVALGRLYGVRQSKVYVGVQAREDRFKTEGRQARVLHFATHGILNNGSPMYSHLALAQGDKNEDGLLEAWELMQLDLNADFAVLSACETGRGRFGAGEGMIGLTWAMFMAGVPSIVVSQWKVESASTSDLMLSFHRQLKLPSVRTNGSKAEALRQAALKLLKNRQTNHPFYWAGFVVVGDG